MNELRTLLFLKNQSKTGKVSNSFKSREKYSQILNISERTLRRHLYSLDNYKWIGLDNYKNIYLRSWERIEKVSGFIFTSRVEFHYTYIKKKSYVAYYMGAVISYQCKLKNFKLWEEQKNGGSKPSRYLQHPISLEYLSNLLKIPESTIQVYKRKAIDNKFVNRNKNIEKTDIDIATIDIVHFRKNWSEKSFPTIIKNSLCIVSADSFNSNLCFSRYRNGQKRLQ